MFSSRASSPTTIPSTPPPPPTASPPAAQPRVDDTLDDDTRLPSGRAPLRLTDLVAAVRETGLHSVEAVADRLEEHYRVDSGGEALQTMLIGMHAARQDLARHLREDAVRLRLAGFPAEAILQSALRYFDVILGDQSTY